MASTSALSTFRPLANRKAHFLTEHVFSAECVFTTAAENHLAMTCSSANTLASTKCLITSRQHDAGICPCKLHAAWLPHNLLKCILSSASKRTVCMRFHRMRSGYLRASTHTCYTLNYRQASLIINVPNAWYATACCTAKQTCSVGCTRLCFW